MFSTRSSGDRATVSGTVCRGFESSRVQFIMRRDPLAGGVLMMAYQGSRTSIDSDGVLMPAVNLNLLSLYVDISGSKGDT